MTKDADWKQIHRVADQLTPELRRQFLAAFETLAKLIPLNTLTELIETEAFDAIETIITGLKLPDPKPIQDALQTAAVQTGKYTATGFDMSFTLDNPAVVQWVEKYTGDLITGITTETKNAVRSIVREGFIEGIPPRTQARQIRRIVGLTERDAGTVDRFLRGQLDAGIPTKRAETMADKMAKRLLKRRAENIARTEGIRAANRGQYVAWQDAADAGLIDTTRTRVVWIATEDSRTCPTCIVLDGKTVGFGEPFVSNVQAVDFTDNGDSFTIHSTKPLKTPVAEQTPPAHPSGRCSLGLVFD